jgi:hypothetical protein
LEHYVQQRDAAFRLRDLITQANGMVGSTNQMTEQIQNLLDALAATDDDHTELEEACRTALNAIEAFRDDLLRPPPRMGYRQRPRLREELSSLFSSVTSIASRPTEPELLRLGELEEETATMQRALDELVATRIAEVNRLAGELPRIIVP